MATTALFADLGPQYRPAGMPPEIGEADYRVQSIIKKLAKAEPKVLKWRSKAKECYRFRDNKQLSEEDERELKAQGRPNTAFNIAQKFIRYISGVQRDSPIAVLFNAVDFDNDQIQMFSERITKYHDWAYQKANTNDAIARAFEDSLVGGLGVVNNFIDHSVDPCGLVGTPWIDPFEMFWPDSIEINFKGLPWIARESYVEREEAKALFTSEDARFLIDNSDTDGSIAPMMTWPVVDRVPYKIPYVQTYPLDSLGTKDKPKSSKVKILEWQHWQNQPGRVFEDPLDQTEQWMTNDEFAEYEAELKATYGMEVGESQPQMGRKWERMFILNRRYLLEEPSALPGSRFTFACLCSHFDHEDRLPYGFMRVLMDPQRYANKFFNQMIEINAKQAKGGVIAELGAFDDKAMQVEFENTYAQTGAVNIVADGGIAKIKDKMVPQTSQGTMAIIQFINSSMQNVTGISEDSLGIGASTAAGVTLKRRQRAGMVLLAAEFDAEAELRKEEGYIIYDHLKLIADSRLIRISGHFDDEPEVIRLADAPFSLKYEIELDEVERDPNMRAFLADLVMGPFGQTAMRTGKWIDDFYNVLPIPRRWIQTIKATSKQREDQQQQMAAMGIPTAGGRGAKKSVPELQAIIENKKADTAVKRAKAVGIISKVKQDGDKGQRDDLASVLEMIRAGLEERRLNQQHAMDMSQGPQAQGGDQGGVPQNFGG